MIPVEHLAALPLFRELPREATDLLASRGTLLRFPSDSVIFRAGDPPRGWYVVLEGSVRVVRDTGSRQHVIHTEKAGGTLAEVPLFAGGTHPATALADRPTVCALFALPAIRDAMAESETVSLLFLRRLALRVHALVDRLDDRAAHNIRNRLLTLVKQRAAAAHQEVFSLGMTQQKLAEELGTVREVVVRELRRLREEGLLESLGGGRYRFR